MCVIDWHLLSPGAVKCKMCASRHKLQSKYLEQVSLIFSTLCSTKNMMAPYYCIHNSHKNNCFCFFSGQIHDLYEDFHITECPLLLDEVRGREKVEAFAKFLVQRND